MFKEFKVVLFHCKRYIDDDRIISVSNLMQASGIQEQYNVEAWASPIESKLNYLMANRPKILPRRFDMGKHTYLYGLKFPIFYLIRSLKISKETQEYSYVENAGPSSSERSLNVRDTRQSMPCSPSRSRVSPSKSSDEHSV